MKTINNLNKFEGIQSKHIDLSGYQYDVSDIDPKLELKRMRVGAGIKIKDLCNLIGVEHGVYSLYENGVRVLDEDKYDYLYWKVSRAINKIKRTEEYQYTHITVDDLKRAIAMHEKGLNIIKIATTIGVDEKVLKNEFISRDLSPIEFSKY